MELRLYNTLSRQLETFEPLEKGRVRLYCCGPTVYNYAHIGNLRTYIFEDILHRTLEFLGYRVDHVMNITDVGHLSDDGDEGEDKMIKGARERGMTVWDIAEFFTRAFFADSRKLRIRRPDTVCRATDHIAEMIAMIRRLEENGLTYLADGNVYFDTARFPHYHELARLDRQELKAGARIEVDSNKRNAQDFVLWFTNSKFGQQAMLWDSPWGRGYPGWHIECSAMSHRYLGDQFDIHCGGVDHINVHHTNEIAQTEGACGRHPWVKYWLHAEFLLENNAKMAKSAGGFLTVSRLEELGYDPLDYRYFCLGAHYRTQLSYGDQGMDAARVARQRLLDRVAALVRQAGPDGESFARSLLPPPVAAGNDGVTEGYRVVIRCHEALALGAAIRTHLDEFLAALCDDLNMSRALAKLWDVLKRPELGPRDQLSLVAAMDEVLGLDILALALDRLEAEALKTASQTDFSPEERQELDRLLEERSRAKKARDFAAADRIRDSLKARGIIITDGPQGASYRRE